MGCVDGLPISASRLSCDRPGSRENREFGIRGLNPAHPIETGPKRKDAEPKSVLSMRFQCRNNAVGTQMGTHGGVSLGLKLTDPP